MSLSSWKKEFYPIPASKVKEADALEHSIQKWTGALRKNTRKHKVVLGEGCIEEPNSNRVFDFSGDSCALCHFYYDFSHCGECKNCSLYKSGFGCESDCGVYYEALDTKRPQLMINALKKARKYVYTGFNIN